MLPGARHAEYHQRVVDAPIEEVWPHCLTVTAKEVRLLGPLMALRSLPAVIAGGRKAVGSEAVPLLDTFVDSGFLMLWRDEAPTGGTASVAFGGAGRFWSMRNNLPVAFADPGEFIAFTESGHAKTVARLDAVDLGDGTTRLETETLIAGTDPAGAKRFAPYWALIRLPSGAIRRSWLAAIDRRAAR